jgi:mono/diheme cytochrome c family protein
MLTRRCRAIVAAAAIGLCAACGDAPSSDASSRSGSPASGASGGGPIKVNLDEIFPPGPGRELVLNNCQNCHTFVPIVVLQMEKDAWYRNSLDHRERVTKLTDEEFKTVYEYLTTNFGPHRPVPKLPKELLETWTSY